MQEFDKDMINDLYKDEFDDDNVEFYEEKDIKGLEEELEEDENGPIYALAGYMNPISYNPKTKLCTPYKLSMPYNSEWLEKGFITDQLNVEKDHNYDFYINMDNEGNEVELTDEQIDSLLTEIDANEVFIRCLESEKYFSICNRSIYANSSRLLSNYVKKEELQKEFEKTGFKTISVIPEGLDDVIELKVNDEKKIVMITVATPNISEKETTFKYKLKDTDDMNNALLIAYVKAMRKHFESIENIFSKKDIKSSK